MLWEQTDFSKLFSGSKICKLDWFVAWFVDVIDGNTSHYVYIKYFNRFTFYKTKNRNKKYFFKSCLQCFSCKDVLTKHKEVCLSINGAQSIRLEKGTIEFKNYFKQIPVPIKVYDDFEYWNLWRFLLKKKIKITFLVILVRNLFVLMMNLLS